MGAGKIHGNHTADQRLCFHYIDSTVPLLPKSKITRPDTEFSEIIIDCWGAGKIFSCQNLDLNLLQEDLQKN